MKRENDIMRINVILEEVISDKSLKKGLTLVNVKEAWYTVMGNGVMSYTEDVSLKGTQLIVKLSSTSLREELSYGKDKIISMLNKELNKELIKTIRFA
ncbi:DUF721 domain-containing protein [Namhaeicola litoreus]|uniref:DUF721 domain-containing protein n=1 Tax=Namhaeicola litoreus TaxID=1052145 RepID=A0ABW3Y607_9FLAO